MRSGTMATFHNESQTQNQVGRDQHVQGPLYNVNNTLNFALPSMLQLANFGALLSSASHDDNILASLSFPEMFLRRGDVEQPYTNTCQWVLRLDQYVKWQANLNGLLWIKGTPGSGKSTLMLFLHNTLRQQAIPDRGIDLEFFFSARGVLLQRTPIGMLRSLLNQLFRKDTDIRTPIRDFYEEKCVAFGRGQHDWTWQRRDLEDLFSTAIISSAQERQVTIFIDALDEAGEDSAREIAAFFHRLNDQIHKRSARAKVCISCRHYPVTSVIPGLEVWVEKHNYNDITDFVQAHLNLSNITDQDELQQWQTITGDLVRRANGLFQWVRLVVPMVEKWIFDHEDPNEVSKWLQAVPQALADVYGYVIEHVISSKLYSQTFMFFQWICLAERPLLVQEMRYALAAEQICCKPRLKCHETQNFIKQDEKMIQRVKALSGGLAEVVREKNEEMGIVQVVHQSVNDFLMERGLFLLANLSKKSGNAEFHRLDEKTREQFINQCQARLYWSCLKYLITEDVAHCWMWSEYDERRDELVTTCPWIRYVTMHVFHHAEKAVETRGQYVAIDDEVDLLEHISPRWIKMYKTIDQLAKGCPSFNSTVLHIAAAANLIDMVTYLIKKKVDVNAQNGFGQTPFHVAIWWGHRNVAEKLLSVGASMTVKTRSNKTPLMIAAQNGHLKLIDWLFEEETRLLPKKQRSSNGALQAAAEAGESAIVKKLIDNGAVLSSDLSFKSTILVKACTAGHERVVALLLAAGVDANSNSEYLRTALEEACVGGHEKVVYMLLAAGTDVNRRYGKTGGNCALDAAITHGHVRIVRMLLVAGAKTEFEDQSSETALQLAVRGDSIDIVKLLLDAGADVHAAGAHPARGSRDNALYIASAAGKIRMVHVLLEGGARPDALGSVNSSTALYGATAMGRIEVLQTLIAAGADLNAHARRDSTALEVACLEGYEAVVRILLDAGADVNLGSSVNRQMPLCAASFGGHEAIVRLLLTSGADVEARGLDNGTALQLAASQGHEGIVKILLNAEADVNALGLDELGSALHAAVAQGHVEIAELLLGTGANVNAKGGLYGNALQAAVRLPDEVWLYTTRTHSIVRGREDLVNLLLEAGAKINAKGGSYDTALCAAAASGNERCVEVLVEAGADINAGGDTYKDAVIAAGEHVNIINYLAERGGDEVSVATVREQIADKVKEREQSYIYARSLSSHRGYDGEYHYPLGKTRARSMYD